MGGVSARITNMDRAVAVSCTIIGIAALACTACGGKPEKLVASPEAEKITESTVEESAEVAQELRDVRYSQSKGDKLLWELVAKSVEQMADGPTNLEDVQTTYYSEDDKVTVLTADSGLYDSATRNVILRGNVVVTTSDGNSLKTDVLTWNQEEDLLRGDGNVTINKGNSVIEGKGFELSPSLETIEIFEVGGTIHQGDMEL